MLATDIYVIYLLKWTLIKNNRAPFCKKCTQILKNITSINIIIIEQNELINRRIRLAYHVIGDFRGRG